MIRYLQLSADIDIDRLLALVWAQEYADIRASWAAYAARPPEQKTLSLRYSFSLPPHGGPVTWVPRLRAWKWRRREPTRIEIVRARGGGAVAVLAPRRRDPQARSALAQWVSDARRLRCPGDADLAALRGVGNLAWDDPAVLAGEDPAQKGRLQIGSRVRVTGLGQLQLNHEAQEIAIMSSDILRREDLTGKFDDAISERETSAPGA